MDLMGPLPRGESLLVTVDYYSTWVEVDVVRSTTSSAIIRCFENHFTRHGISEALRTENGSNLVSHEMEEFLDELGIKHKKTIPLWPRANGEVESKINRYSRQCVRHRPKENHGNKNCRNIFLRTGQHLTPRPV